MNDLDSDVGRVPALFIIIMSLSSLSRSSAHEKLLKLYDLLCFYFLRKVNDGQTLLVGTVGRRTPHDQVMG
jgi:hypothetical protein